MEKTIIATIKSILVGIIVTIIFGYIFSNKTYKFRGRNLTEYAYENSDRQKYILVSESFNYKVGLICGAVVISFCMFVLYDEQNKEKLKKLFGKKNVASR